MKVVSRCSLVVVGGALTALSGFATPAIAADETATLEEIIVTAEKREENLQTMSLSIVALDGGQLAAEGKTNIESVLATVPGVKIQDSAFTGGTPFIRGVGPALGTDPSAAVNLDGVYLSEGLFGAQFDVARVEVLRGPQGTLYGRNATAGSVNIITNSPTDKFEGSGSLQLGNYSAVRTEGALNIPVSDNFSMRVAGIYSKHDGYMSNGTMDEDIKAGRVKMKYTPTDTLTLSLSAEYLKSGGNGQGSTQAPLSSHSDPWETKAQTGGQNSSRKAITGQLDWDVGFGTLTYLPAAYETLVYGDYQLLYGNPGMGLIVSHQRNRQQTHELRLASSADQSLKWLIGAYYLDNKGVANSTAKPLASGTHDPVSTNDVSPTETKSKAVFGQTTIPVTDRFRLIAGARYTWDEKLAARTYYDPSASDSTVSYVGAPIIDISPSASFKTNKFTYKAGVEYDVAENNMLYATYSTGFKSGGINDPTSTASDATYKPEEIKSFEFGSKNRFLDNRLQLNLSAFHYDYSDYQVFTVFFPAVGVPTIAVLNAASATLQGFELESVFQADNADRLHASVAYNDNKFDKFIFLSNAYPDGLDRSGTRLPQAPVWTWVLGYDHDFAIGNNTLTVGAEGRRYSAFDASIEPATDSHQPAYTMLDGHATYQPAGANWSLNAYINNATNEAVRQFTREIPPLDVHELTIGAPRTFGVGVTAKF